MRRCKLPVPLVPTPVAPWRWSGSVTIRYCHQSAEAALAAAVFGYRAFKRGAVEIWPVDRHEDELAIGSLPEQEVGEPLLAAGTDDHVGIGNVRSVQMAAEPLRRNLIDRQASLGHLCRQLLSGTGDLLARAVIEGDHEGETVVAAGEVFGLLQQHADVAVETFALADDTHPHIALV